MRRGTDGRSEVVLGTLLPRLTSLWRERLIREPQDDVAAIGTLVSRFVRSWLEGDAPAMARCLHPDLEKRLLHVGEPLEPRRALTRMRALRKRPDWEVRTDILDVRERMASALSRVGPWVAYIHLGRDGGRWTIVNLLWEWP